MNTYRELILDISEIDENSNAFAIALKMAKALNKGEITSTQYESLSKQLFYECKRNNVNTSNEICSLF